MSPSPLLSSPWQATAFPMDNDCFLHAERRMDRRGVFVLQKLRKQLAKAKR